jgi:hypothetical protein
LFAGMKFRFAASVFRFAVSVFRFAASVFRFAISGFHYVVSVFRSAISNFHFAVQKFPLVYENACLADFFTLLVEAGFSFANPNFCLAVRESSLANLKNRFFEPD